MENERSFLKSLFTAVGVLTTLAALAAAACVLYKKYKESIAAFNAESVECEEECEECENFCGVEETPVEVSCDYAEETTAEEEISE